MKTEEMMEFYMSKYSGEFNKDFAKEIDSEFATNRVLCEEYLKDLKDLYGLIEDNLSVYIMNMMSKKKSAAEQYLVEIDYLAHELVHSALSLWTQIEGMMPEED